MPIIAKFAKLVHAINSNTKVIYFVEKPSFIVKHFFLLHYSSAKVLVKGEPNVSYICSRYYRAPELIFGATDYTVNIGKCVKMCVCVCVCVYARCLTLCESVCVYM